MLVWFSNPFKISDLGSLTIEVCFVRLRLGEFHFTLFKFSVETKENFTASNAHDRKFQ